MKEEIHIGLVAGEVSGDRLGALLMAALKRISVLPVRFSGFGGPLMAEEGLGRPAPIEGLAIIGLRGVFSKLPWILRQIKETAQSFIKDKPDLLLIIDSPEFTHRVAKKFHKEAPHIPIVNLVPPAAWAWGKGRARRIKRYIKKGLVIFPFEPKAFRELEGPDCVYVGHPGMDMIPREGEGAAFRKQHGISQKDIVLLLAPGSRAGEIRFNLPLFLKAVKFLAAMREEKIWAVFCVASLTRDAFPQTMDTGQAHLLKVEGEEERRRAFGASNAALAKSGTITMELGLANVPLICATKITPFETMGKQLVLRNQYLCSVNIVLGKEAFPEHITHRLYGEELARGLQDLLFSKTVREKSYSDSGQSSPHDGS